MEIYRVISWTGSRTSGGGYESSEFTEACYTSLEEARKHVTSAYEEHLKNALKSEDLCDYYTQDEIIKMFHKGDDSYLFKESDDSWEDNGMNIEKMKLFETFQECKEES